MCENHMRLLPNSIQRVTVISTQQKCGMIFMYQLGNLFGILTAVLFGGAILNFVVKFVNRKWVV